MDLPADWGFGAQAEVDHVQNSDSSDYHQEFIHTVTVSHDIAGKLAGYVELYSNVSTESGAKWIATFDFGFTYAITRDIQLDAGMNIGLTSRGGRSQSIHRTFDEVLIVATALWAVCVRVDQNCVRFDARAIRESIVKALFLTNEYPPNVYGGAGVHVDYLSRELAKIDADRSAVLWRSEAGERKSFRHADSNSTHPNSPAQNRCDLFSARSAAARISIRRISTPTSCIATLGTAISAGFWPR